MIQDIFAYLALGQGDHARRHFLRVMNRPVRYMKRDSLPETKVEREALTGYYADTPLIQDRVKRFYRDIDNLAGKRVHLQIHYIRKVIGYESFLREKYGSEKAEELIRIGEEFEAFSRQFTSVREMKAYMEQYAEVVKERERNGKERVMFYVAMTRAKNKLCLLYHDEKTGKNKPSRFLNPLLSAL